MGGRSTSAKEVLRPLLAQALPPPSSPLPLLGEETRGRLSPVAPPRPGKCPPPARQRTSPSLLSPSRGERPGAAPLPSQHLRRLRKCYPLPRSASSRPPPALSPSPLGERDRGRPQPCRHLRRLRKRAMYPLPAGPAWPCYARAYSPRAAAHTHDGVRDSRRMNRQVLSSSAISGQIGHEATHRIVRRRWRAVHTAMDT